MQPRNAFIIFAFGVHETFDKLSEFCTLLIDSGAADVGVFRISAVWVMSKSLIQKRGILLVFDVTAVEPLDDFRGAMREKLTPPGVKRGHCSHVGLVEPHLRRTNILSHPLWVY